jgi:8-oxo-dGTP pyrophosphatase MutT (NUDIX family)
MKRSGKMAADIKISTPEYNFKYRVGGVVSVNDKLLIVRIADNAFYCLPGGHVELGEDSSDAILREMHEEVGYPVRIINCLAIVENFFKGHENKNFHELGFYFLVEPNNINEARLEDYTIIENDKGIEKQLEFRWVTIEELRDIDFRPQFLKEKLIHKDYYFIHKIIKEATK